MRNKLFYEKMSGRASIFEEEDTGEEIRGLFSEYNL